MVKYTQRGVAILYATWRAQNCSELYQIVGIKLGDLAIVTCVRLGLVALTQMCTIETKEFNTEEVGLGGY